MKTVSKRTISIIAAWMLIIVIHVNVNAQNKSEKNWTLSGNLLTTSDFLGSTNNFPIILKTNNVERLRVTTAGNLGLGVINPSEKLEINGGLKLNAVTPGNSANGTIIFNGTEFLVRKNGLWMSLVYKSPWDTTTVSVYTGRNVGVGVNNPKEKLEINGAMRLLSYNKSKVKGDMEDGTVFYDGTDILGVVDGEIKSLTGGEAPDMWILNNGTVSTTYKVGIGLGDAQTQLHMANSSANGIPYVFRLTHKYNEPTNWNEIQEEPLNIDLKGNIIETKTEVTRDFDICNRYGFLYFKVTGNDNYIFGLSATTIQTRTKLICEENIVGRKNIFIYDNLSIGNGYSVGATIPNKLYVKGTSALLGDVNIGDETLTASLSVKGNVAVGENVKIYADGKMWVKNTIKVNVNKPEGWGDFVFDSNYDLKSLSEVEAYIKEHKHLNGIPSAKEIEAEGIDLGAMTNTLTQKVEELTLYMIEMNKTIELLKKENEELKKEIKK